MEIRLASKKATPLSGIEPVLTAIEQRLHHEPEAWLKQLQSRPGSFAELETDLWVTTLYVGSAARTGKGRGREGAGLYPELGVLGIQEGKSPALRRRSSTARSRVQTRSWKCWRCVFTRWVRPKRTWWRFAPTGRRGFGIVWSG